VVSVVQYRDFTEDGRTSMEVYADNLFRALGEVDTQGLDIVQYRPRLNGFAAALPQTANIRMRAARYLHYPRQARGRPGTVNHILDQGYAHLLGVLDPARTLVTVHDLIPVLAGRGRIPGIRRARRSWLAEWTAHYYRRAARVVAISESTKRDLVRYCGCDPARIEVVYYGIYPAFHPIPSIERPAARAALGLPASGRLVLITGQEYYKNQATSVRVCERLRERFADLRLVRLGRATAEWDELRRRSALRDAILEIDFLPAEAMPRLYNAVDCLLFPSWYEGFGWPPLEAMACGTPAVTSNVASLPEAVGHAGLTAAPDDVDGLAAHVGRLLEDHAFRAERIALGLRHAQGFNWQHNARSLVQIYKQLAG